MLQVDRLMDGLVRQVAVRLVGEGGAQGLADLLRAPAPVQVLLVNSFSFGSRRSLPSLERARRTQARRWAWNGW
jgi:hypothetical protein